MKQLFLYSFVAFFFCVTMSSCEGCVKKTTKKVTNIGLDAIEGIAEAVQERGDSIGKKVFDAGGQLAEGAGRSINQQLNEHAEHVASVVGRTMVQTLDGLDEGITTEYYDELISKEDFCSDVSLDFFGKIQSKAVTDAYFIILKEGSYTFNFEFCADNCKTPLLTKTAEYTRVDTDRKYTIISFAYNSDEEEIVTNAKCVKITVRRK